MYFQNYAKNLCYLVYIVEHVCISYKFI